MTSCLCFRHVFSSKKKSQETPVTEEQKEEKPVAKMTTQTKSLKVKLPRHTTPTDARRAPGTTPQHNNWDGKNIGDLQC